MKHYLPFVLHGQVWLQAEPGTEWLKVPDSASVRGYLYRSGRNLLESK